MDEAKGSEMCIDYRCEDRKIVGDLKGKTDAIIRIVFQQPISSSPPKNEPFGQEMYMKIPLSTPD
jgi:hypothetical protein